MCVCVCVLFVCLFVCLFVRSFVCLFVFVCVCGFVVSSVRFFECLCVPLSAFVSSVCLRGLAKGHGRSPQAQLLATKYRSTRTRGE